MKLFKKNEKKAATKLSMTGKVRKGFRFYCLAVMAVTFMPVSYTHLEADIQDAGEGGCEECAAENEDTKDGCCSDCPYFCPMCGGCRCEDGD